MVFIPGAAQAANILWTAPADGQINIAGFTWWPEEFICYFGIELLGSWTLTHNGAILSSGDIPVPECGAETRSVPHAFSTGSGESVGLQNIPVVAGDQIVLTYDSFERFGVSLTITLTTADTDPVAAIENLAISVFDMNLQNGIENSLDSKLDAALNALDDANVSNDGAACNSISAFISAVEAQRGNKITSAQADG